MKKRLLFITTIILIISTLTGPALGASEEMLQGSIEDINLSESKITVLDYDGKSHTINVLPSTIIEIEEVKHELRDLYYGQDVDIILYEGRVIKIIGYLEEDPERTGYIMPGSRFKIGDVLFLTEDSIEIKVRDERERYRLTPFTNIYKDSGIISINQIKEGDKVLLTFDDIYSAEVSTLRVQDDEEYIKGVLRGKIYSVDDRKEEVYITSPYIYKEGKGWIPYGDHIVKLKVKDKNLYNGGNRISLKDLAKQKGNYAYIAFNSSFGRLNVAKLQIKSGSSRMYESPIEDIEYGRGKMIVDKNIIHFNEGTIVVKDNRLVDVLNIDRYKDVFVNADLLRGNAVASLVSIEGTSMLEERTDGTRISIYKGKIKDIFEYEVEIGRLSYRLDYQRLTEEHKWIEENKELRFQLTEDTLIYDSQLDKEIPVNHFIKSRYIDLNDIKDITLRNRIKNNYYKNKTAYFVVKESTFGNEVLALNIAPNINQYRYNVNTDYSTIGEVKEINYDEGTITFTKVKNYNTLNGRWENSTDQSLPIDKAVILLNDLPLPKDKLYTLRPGSKGYIVKYKQSSMDTGYVILIEY